MKKLLFLIAATAIFSLTLSSCGDKQKESLPAAPAVQPSETDQILKAQEEVLRLQQKQVDIIKNNEKIAENQKFLRPDCGDCEEKVVKKPCPPVKKPIIAKPKPPCCVEKPEPKKYPCPYDVIIDGQKYIYYNGKIPDSDNEKRNMKLKAGPKGSKDEGRWFIPGERAY